MKKTLIWMVLAGMLTVAHGEESPQRWAGKGSNGSRVTAQLTSSGMEIAFATSGSRLSAKREGDNKFVFEGKKFRYIAQRSGEAWQLTEYHLDGRESGWQAELHPVGQPPVLSSGKDEKEAVTHSKSSTYRVPAYLTNVYFSDQVRQEGRAIQPGHVINVLPAAQGKEIAFLIMDLLFQTGKHHISVAIIEPGKGRANTMLFDPINATRDDFVVTLVGVVTGPYAKGRIMFKIYDRINDGNTITLATHSILVRPVDATQTPMMDSTAEPFATPLFE